MGRIKFMVIMAFLTCLFTAPPVSSDTNMVITTDATNTANPSKKGTAQMPIIISMNIDSSITNRFAHTLVKTKVKNPSNVAQETTFFAVMPDKAYISSFTMEIGRSFYKAHVEEKEAAKKTYQEAVASGQNAALVAVSPRHSKKFTVSVSVEPRGKATFYLTYEELLERKFGYYEHIINIHPKQLVQSINVLVEINELKPLSFVKTPQIRSGNAATNNSKGLDPNATINRPESNKGVVTFSPDIKKQKEIARCLGTDENEGMSAQFVVQYDVERDPQGGEVLVKDGYFVHFFAPSNLQPLHKHMVFVLDISLSMTGRKIEQLKEAMKSILRELKSIDLVSMVEFAHSPKVWMSNSWDESNAVNYNDISAFPVNNDTIEKATKAVDDMTLEPATNIYDALCAGLDLIKFYQQRTGDKDTQPIIFFLTDGEANTGRTQPDDILSGLSQENTLDVPIISLSFGAGADRKLLERISRENKGFARYIYEESDASLQLENFYEEISSPLLHNVKFSYTPDVTSLTKTQFPMHFGGTEFVIAGKIPGGQFNSSPQVSGTGPTGPIVLTPTVTRTVGPMERLWAYLTVKKHLDDLQVPGNNINENKRKALEVSFQFSFVTPLTSLVVVKPIAGSGVATKTANITANNTSSGNPLTNNTSSGNPLIVGGNGTGGGITAGPPSNAGGNAVVKPTTGPPSYYGGSGIGGGSTAASPSNNGGSGNGGGSTAVQPSYPNNISSGSPLILGGSANGAGVHAGLPLFPAFPPPGQPGQDPVIIFSSVPPLAPPRPPRPTTSEIVDTEEENKLVLPESTPEPATLPPEYISDLGWLEQHLTPDGSLSFSNGTYKLGFNETSPANQECTTPTGEEGLCKFIKDCEGLLHIVKTVQAFEDNFCNIDDKFAGVCCPN